MLSIPTSGKSVKSKHKKPELPQSASVFCLHQSDQTAEKYGPCKLEQASCASPPSHTAKAQNRTENTPGGYRLTPGIKLSITALIPQEDKGGRGDQVVKH